MRPGDMRWRVTILRQTDETNEWGERVDAWTELRTVRAQKIHRTEGETFAAGQRQEVRSVAFRLYWTPDVYATDRLRCDGLEYDIRGLRELGFRRGLEITAELRT